MSATPEAELAREALQLERLRAAILDRLIGVVTLLAIVPVVGGIWLSFANDVPVIAAFDAACWILLVTLWRARLPQRVRALGVLVLLASAGHVLLAVVGPLSLGGVWLGGVPALAGVLFDRRAFWWASGLVVASLVALAVAVHGSAAWTVGGQPVSVAWWLTAASSIVCVACLVGLPASYLVTGLERALALEARSRDALREVAAREAALHRQFEELFARTPQALLAVDAGGRIAQRNEAARALFDAPGAAEPTTLDALFPDAEVAAAARRCAAPPAGEPVAPGAAFAGVVGPARRADGAPLVVEASVVPLEIAGARFALVGATDVALRVEAERRLSQALRDKETLLKEVHHRVKNNLQIVSSMLGMQAAGATSAEARAVLDDSTHRIRAMALIHQQLYGRTDFASIELGDYARALASALQGALDPSAELRLDVEVVAVPLGQALPCGLILNELVTNAFKHGRSADGVGRVVIELRRDADGFVLGVADGGRGQAEDWARLRTRSLGAQIVTSLVRQLRATLDVTSGPTGTRFSVRCPPAPADGAG